MDPITLTPHPAEGHSSTYTLEVAGAVADAVRVLNYATLSHNAEAGVPYPSTAYDVVSRLHAAVAGMDQLTRQLADRVAEIAATREITVSHGIFTGDPAAAVGAVLESLDTVRQAAAGLAGALGYAQRDLSPIGVRITTDDSDDPAGGAAR